MINWKKQLDEIFIDKWPDPDPLRPISKAGIVLYGAGAMGKMAIDFMKKSKITPVYIVDIHKSGTFNGINIIQPDDISDLDKQNLTFIVCIASIPVMPVYSYLKQLGCMDVRHFYDYSEILFPKDMTNGWVVKAADRGDIESVIKLLEHDYYSVAHYLQFLWWRLQRREVINHDYPILSNKKFFNAPCIPILSNDERFLDGGAHYGQSIYSFLEK